MSPARARARAGGAKEIAASVDLVLFTPYGRALAVLLRPSAAGGRERWELPWEFLVEAESLDAAAQDLAHAAGGRTAWMDQAGTFGAGKHPGDAALSISFVAILPRGAPPPPGGNAVWFPIGALPPLPARHRSMVQAGLAALKLRMDVEPIAFRLLPATFTLSELQEMYEILLGRRLHKASFRRALQTAWIVEPTEEWRSSGRGRPAQLYRYAPRRRRGAVPGRRRSVRFDLLGRD